MSTTTPAIFGLLGTASIYASVVLFADRDPVRVQQSIASLQKAQQAVSGKVKVTALVLEGRVLNRFELRAGARSGGAADPTTGEFLFLLPDHYRSSQINSGSMQYRGFRRDVPLLGVKAVVGTGSASYSDPAQFVERERIVAARLLLGILGITDGPLPLNVAAGATAGSVRLTGAGDFDCRVELDPATGVPVRLVYTQMMGFLPPPVPGEKSSRSGPPERADVTMTFADRRQVSGVLIPHRITTSAKGLATGQEAALEDLRLEKVFVNPPLTAADFDKAPF